MAVVNYRSLDEVAAHIESRDEMLRFFMENPHADIRINGERLPREIRVRINLLLELGEQLGEQFGL